MTEKKNTVRGCVWWTGLIGLSGVFVVFILVVLLALISPPGTSTNTLSSPTPTMSDAQLQTAVPLAFDELARDTEAWTGKLVRVRGQVIQVVEAGSQGAILRVNVTQNESLPGLWNDTVWVEFPGYGPGQRVLQNDVVEFVGRVDGRHTYESVLGGKITLPALTALTTVGTPIPTVAPVALNTATEMLLTPAVPPADTPVPPVDTPVPPADMPVPPADMPVPPADMPVLPTSTANTTVNLYAQPDLGSAVIAVAQPGQPMVVAGQDSSGQWLQLVSSYWIEASAVSAIPSGLPVTMQLSGGNPTPLSTSVPISANPVANTTVTVHEGPSIDAAVVITAQPGQQMTVAGQDSTGQWLQLASGYWVTAAAIDNVPAGLPVVDVAAQQSNGNPTVVPTVVLAEAAEPTATPLWQREESGVIFTSNCPCDQGDTLNCSNFDIDIDAQACYLRCMDLTSLDVHELDGDEDGTACEWSW